jgi:hypothetical protein
MITELTFGRIREIFLTMQRISGKETSSLFAFGLSINKSKIQDCVNAIAEVDKAVLPFTNARIALCEKYAVKDEKTGKPVINNNIYQGVDNNPLFQAELRDLINLHFKVLEENDRIMRKKISIDFYMIDFEDVPKLISPVDYDILSVIISPPKSATELETLKKENEELKKKVADFETIKEE